jgi:hypothetical protein
MKASKFTEAQIAFVLRQADAARSQKRTSGLPSLEHAQKCVSRADTWRPCLYPHDPYRRGRARNSGAVEYPRSRPRMVGRQHFGLLHRSAGTGCNTGNAAFLPRAFASTPGRLEPLCVCVCVSEFRECDAPV